METMSENRNRFNKLLDRVTRPGTVEGKRTLKRKLLGMIHNGEVQLEDALFSISEKMANTDPYIAILSIDILDSWVMICGSLIQDQIVKVGYMETLRELLENTSNEKIKFEILHLIQDWSQTFEDPIIRETIEVLKAEGYEFPSESDVVISDVEEQDNSTCHRCNIISSLEEKLNCEVCGKTFCNECMICRNDDHEIVNLVCALCDLQFVARNVTKTNSTTLAGNDTISSGNEMRNLNQYRDVLEGNEEDDLDLAIALSESQQVTDKLNTPPSGSSDSNYKDNECSVCCERKVDSMLNPCSHMCMCFNCANEQWKGVGNGCCPLCRIEIEDVIRI
ncbi:hepatocyte growth factor-regulated tyrosine kinase substrate-like [Halyomorpha halys]|uniref:hepatocyte growth factor-regulated tyrosine kinase substrate-like n=1 Tax=Halyomorpha halys TaxID=286706 RepID=UPI0006D4D068